MSVLTGWYYCFEFGGERVKKKTHDGSARVRVSSKQPIG